MLRNPFILNGLLYMNMYYPKTKEENLEFYKVKLKKK